MGSFGRGLVGQSLVVANNSDSNIITITSAIPFLELLDLAMYKHFNILLYNSHRNI